MDDRKIGRDERARKLVSTCPGIAISFASNSDYAPMNLDVGVISREVYLTRSQRRMRIVLTVHIHARCAVRWKYILWKNWRGSFSTRANFYIFEVGYFHHGFPSFSPLSLYPLGEGTRWRRNRLIKHITPSFERDVASSKILLTHCVFSRDEGRDAFSSTR